MAFWDLSGTVSDLDAPGSVQTQATGLNNRGQVVGWYLPPGNTERGTHGFLYEVVISLL